MLQSREFSNEEFMEILRQGRRLLFRGYFTGINFIQSEEPLPAESILIHFLHGRHTQIDYVRSHLSLPSLVVPRFTFYRLRSEYFDKSGFSEEYQNAIFFDSNMSRITIDAARGLRSGITTGNLELDLLVPLDLSSLEATVRDILQANEGGPWPWSDPVIIVRSRDDLPSVSGFVKPGPYISIRRTFEEFYVVAPDNRRGRFVQHFARKVLMNNTTTILSDQSVVFEPCQVNPEFLAYMLMDLGY